MKAEWRQTQYQESLEILLHKFFPNHKILPNTQKKAGIYNASSRKYFEVDVWLPELHLCFEFQDVYHYIPAWYSQAPLTFVQQRDNFKRLTLINDRQTHISIPCWWGGDEESLEATIHFHRPDLVERRKVEIPNNPPTPFFEENENLCQLMLASFPESNIMEQGPWWIGEKWDGIRCFWDTTAKTLYSRSNVVIDLQTPDENLFGNLVMDAELWCGRGFFEESQATASKSANMNSLLRLLCFDEASLNMQFQPFEKRYSLVLAHMPEDHPAVINAPRVICGSETELQATLQSITTEGGEGMMLRKPLSHYIPGRSDSLFKIKASYMYNDQEAFVAKVEGDGSLLLQLPNGFTFSVDRNDCTLHRKATTGDIVTFRLEEKTEWDQNQDFLSKPVVYRIRSDMSWEDTMPPQMPIAINKSWKEFGERRAFFDAFAASRGLDPRNPTTWYGVIPLDIKKFDKRFRNFYQREGRKLSAILTQLYPEIGLQPSQFAAYRKARKVGARRAFFDKFAASKGMDPLKADFWYSVTHAEIIKYDKNFFLTRRYKKKLSTLLLRVYPEIGLTFKANRISKKQKSGRTFFDKFAAAKGMDPLNPIFWYNISPREFYKSYKIFKGVSTYHGGKLSAIIMEIYPDIGLQQSQFNVHKQGRRRKTVFDKFAAAKGMDPLNPVFWRSVTNKDLLTYDKRFKHINHRGRLAQILTQLYPDVGFHPQTSTSGLKTIKN